MIHSRFGGCFAALVGVFAVTSHHSIVSADELALYFSGTWASATNALSPGATLSDTNGEVYTSSPIVPTAPPGLVGTPFSGVFYFDSGAMGSGGSFIQTYQSVGQGVQTTSYTQADQQISTQSSFSVTFGNYVLTNRSSNTIPDTITTSLVSSPSIQAEKAGFHILPSNGTGMNSSTNIAGAPIIPMASVGLSPSLAWAPWVPVDDPNGNVELDPDFSPPGANTSAGDTNRWSYFLYANALEMDFDLLNSASATLALPTAGPIDLSQYGTAQITFQTSDNAIYGLSDDGVFYMGNLYQDILSVVGNITSAQIVAVPEPSAALLWGGIGVITLLGIGTRKWGARGK